MGETSVSAPRRPGSPALRDLSSAGRRPSGPATSWDTCGTHARRSARGSRARRPQRQGHRRRLGTGQRGSGASNSGPRPGLHRPLRPAAPAGGPGGGHDRHQRHPGGAAEALVGDIVFTRVRSENMKCQRLC
jgi:hypothetical protein